MNYYLQQLSILTYNNFLLENQHTDSVLKLRNCNQFPIAKKRVLCSISGGQDSQLNLYILLYLRKYIQLSVVYCHHFWQFMNFIAFWEIWKNIYVFKIPFYVILTEKSLKTEEEARNWRQEIFKHFNQFYLFQSISLGHTATDRIETSLANLGRGTSPQAIYNLKQKIILKKKYSNLEFLNKQKYFSKNWNKSSSSSQIEKKENKSKIVTLTPSFPYYMVKTPCSLIYRRVVQQKDLSQQYKKTYILNNSFKKFYYKKNKTLIYSQTTFQLQNYSLANTNSYSAGMISSIYKLEKSLTQNLQLIRPLEISYRAEITTNIKENKLSIIFDPTNQNTKLGRNKIRKNVLPILQKNININFEKNFHHFLYINEFEQNFLKNLQTKILKNYPTKDQFRKLPSNLQKQIIHTIFEKYTSRQISYIQIQVLMQKFKKYK